MAALGIPSAALAFLVIYVVASIMLNGSMVFYDAFLVDATTDERYDEVSSQGLRLGLYRLVRAVHPVPDRGAGRAQRGYPHGHRDEDRVSDHGPFGGWRSACPLSAMCIRRTTRNVLLA